MTLECKNPLEYIEAMEFEIKRIVSLADRNIGIPINQHRIWDAKRKITVTKLINSEDES